jgi:hypothetical protein
VSAGGAWTGGITWTYPDGKNSWKPVSSSDDYAYNLEVTGPSGSGSQFQEAVQILSTGCNYDASTAQCVTGVNAVQREIQTVLLPSSAASWQMISNQSIAYGGSATVNGRIYANGNITFGSGGGQTGVNANVYASGTVSASNTYTLGSGANVYSSSTTPSFSTEIPNPINFSSFQTSIADIQRAAQTAGVDLTQTSTPAAWQIVFQSNGTFTAAACNETGGNPVWETAPTCGAPTTYTMPSNGAIYSGQSIIVGSSSSGSTVNGRVTVTSGANIVVGNSITYQAGTSSVLGLNAETDVVMAAWVPNTALTVDGALIDQTGYFIDACGLGDNSACGSRPSATFNGSVATDLGGSMSEFNSRSYNFDTNLLWLDPPWFPMIENPYTILLQREIAPTP